MKKYFAEELNLIRYPRTHSEDYSDLHCLVCYKRVDEDAWMLNTDNLPESVQVQLGGVHVLPFQEWAMDRDAFVKWFTEVLSFHQSDRDIGDCEGATLLEKIQDWFNKESADVQVRACNE